MEIPIKAQVTCTDGLCGKLICILINPVTDQITHLVVKENEGAEREFMVPVDLIKSTSNQRIFLLCSKTGLEKLESFTKTEFVEETMPSVYASYSEPYGIGTHFLWPYVSPEKTLRIAVDQPQIPAGEIVMKRGAHVKALDGVIGQIDEFMVNPENDHITHLVMHRNHIWGHQEIAIPVSAIKEAYKDVVALNISKHEVKSLPALPIKRNWNEN